MDMKTAFAFLLMLLTPCVVAAGTILTYNAAPSTTGSFNLDFDPVTQSIVWKGGAPLGNTSLWTPSVDVQLIAVKASQSGVFGTTPFVFTASDLVDEASLIASGFGDVTNGWMVRSVLTLDQIAFQDSAGTPQTFASNVPFLSVGGTAIDIAGGIHFSSGGQGLPRDELGAFLPSSPTATAILIPATIDFASAAVPEPKAVIPLSCLLLLWVGVRRGRRPALED